MTVQSHERSRRPLGACLLVGALLAASCDERLQRGPSCDGGQIALGGECIQPYEVRVASVGFLPGRRKIATFEGGDGAFVIRDASDDSKVYSGEASGPTMNPDTDQELFQADFSELDEEGEYYVDAGGGRRSPNFRIADDVYDGPLGTVMLGLYGQRCGQKVELEHRGEKFSHRECHMREAGLDYVGHDGETRDDTGGWHDAGDYGKYTVNGAFAVAFLLKAWEDFPERLEDAKFEIPEKGGDVPDILDEARYELEWLLKVQLEDGSAAHKVTALNFEGTIMPAFDAQPRYFVPSGTASTADFAAVLAMAGRLYEPFDKKFAEKCLDAAGRAYQFLQKHPEDAAPMQSDFETGGYDTPGYGDERLWAAAEIWEATGDEAALDEFELIFRERDMRVNEQFDWGNVANLGLFTYLFSERDGKDEAIVQAITEGLLASADQLVENAEKHGYGRALGTDYYWGINGVLARTSFNLAAAYRIDRKPEYLETIALGLGHLFGRNPYGRSYVTGVGADPVARPHHRPSSADAAARPWPGLLVGGPHGQTWDGMDSRVPAALTWADDPDDYRHNEVAINWNTALVYALVAAE